MEKLKLYATMEHLAYFCLCGLAFFTVTFESVALGFHLLFFFPSTYFSYKAIRSKQHLNWSKSMIFCLLFIIAALIGLIVHRENYVDYYSEAKKIRYLIIGLLGVFSLKYLSRQYLDEKKIKVLIGLFFLGGLVATIIGKLSIWFDYDIIRLAPRDFLNRMHGITGIMNYGYETPIMCMVGFSLLLYYRKYSAYIPLVIVSISTLAMSYGVLTSNTRGGVICFVGALPFIAYYKSKKAFISLFACSVALVFYFIYGSIYFTRSDSRMFETIRSESNLIRIALHKQSFQAFQDNPIFGHGLMSNKTYPIIIPTQDGSEKKMFDIMRDSHSTFWQVLADGGIVLGILFFGWMLFWFIEILGLNEMLATVLLSSFVSFQIGNLVHTMLVSGTTTAILIMTLYSISQIRKSSFPRVW